MQTIETIVPPSRTTQRRCVWPANVDLFGLPLTPTTYQEATTAILDAAQLRLPKLVSCHAVHAVVTMSREKALREMARAFDMITPDGQPVRWALNLLYDTRLRDRVYGPDLMLSVCRSAAEQGVSIYLYGGTPEVADQLPKKLREKFPKLQVAGSESPPFRPLSEEEDQHVVERINGSGAGVVFIGLGCPKQDVFAYEHRDRISAVQVCVGAAFDFHAGRKNSAPATMQKWGLEWLFRLCQEPKRLWRRYLVTNTLFLLMLLHAWLARRSATTWQVVRKVLRVASAPRAAVNKPRIRLLEQTAAPTQDTQMKDPLCVPETPTTNNEIRL